MILACPACDTRYAVPDSAIGAEGRTVRCARCRHSWFQEGSELDLETLEQDGSAKVETAQRQPWHDVPPIGASDDTEDDTAGRSQFAAEPPFRPRRNPLKMWGMAASLFAVISVGTIGAVSYAGLPDWVPVSRPTFAMNEPDLVLEFPASQQDRRTLPDGSEYFGVAGEIKNVGHETKAVPPVLIVLYDSRNRKVYNWEILPRQGRLQPGETLSINEAITDLPKSAKFAEIGWSPS
ncbi:zinc-ribbon domain-containing protein [Citromicrobium bathyomarinum]|uniref:zinc-ribbon domain-containing protein n=1 Tax=Citromicrobium bathyomarinum TaxID=72174 RepID=UPI00315A2837